MFPVSRPVQPTYYLGGQPYIYEDHTIGDIPELAERAFMETATSLARLFTFFHAGQPLEEEGCCLSSEEYEHRSVELLMGMWALRQYINKPGSLLPNTSFVIIH